MRIKGQDDAGIRKKRKGLVLVTTYFSIFLLGLYLAFYQYTVIDISKYFERGIGSIGALVAAQHLGICIPPIFFGAVCRSIGKKKVALAAFGLLMLGSVIAGISRYYLLYLVSVFIIGGGFAVTEATMSAVLADEFPDKSAKHLNLSQVGFSIGALCGPFAAEYLIHSGVAIKNLYFGFTGIYLLVAIAFSFSKHENDLTKGTLKPSKGSIEYKVGGFNKLPFYFLALSLFVYVGVENTITNFMGSYMAKEAPDISISALVLALFWGLTIPSRFLVGVIKIDINKAFIFLSLFLTLSLLTALITSNLIFKITMLALAGFACGPLWPIIMNAAAKLNGASTGATFNYMLSFGGLGGALIPLIIGFGIKESQANMAYYAAAALSIVMLMVFLAAYQSNRRIVRKNSGELG